jgi:eukaryotic-like serine/threonine-protein kinase
VERVIGVGGMGAVVAARHVDLETRVAIKFLLPETLSNRDALSRFAREARAAARIVSEHVVRVHDVGTLPSGAPYIVMEYLEGRDLATWLHERGPMPVEQAVDFVLQACVAVADAHGLGIVHRDLKPANLFCVRRSDGQPFIKVLDFGISKVSSPDPGASVSDTSVSAIMGSPHYMSPEQLQCARDVDGRTDIWSLGVVAFELMTGQPPFSGKGYGEILLKVGSQPAPSVRDVRADVPEPVATAIARCLEKDRRARYANVAELATALGPHGSRRAGPIVERIVGILQGAGRGSSPPPGPATAPTLPSDGAAAARSSIKPRPGSGKAGDLPSKPRPGSGKAGDLPSPSRQTPPEIRVKGSVLLAVLQATQDLDRSGLREATVRRLEGELAESVRSGGPMATEWYPIAWHRELLGAVASHAGTTGLRDVVRRSTRDSVGRIHRVVVRMLTPDTLISRSSKLFTSFFEASFTAHREGTGLTRIAWSGCHGFDRNCWLAQVHTVEEMVTMSGAKLLRKSVLFGGEDRDPEMMLEIGWK